MRKPRRYINRKVYFNDGDGAISGQVVKNNQGDFAYSFLSEKGIIIPISFHGKKKVIIKDGVLERKLN